MKLDKMTIIPPDKMIAVNGEAYTGCDVTLEPHPVYGIAYSLQWFGTHGAIQYERGPSLMLKDLSVLETHMAAWLQRRAVVLNEQHDIIAVKLASTTSAREQHETALSDMEASEQTEHVANMVNQTGETLDKLRETERTLSQQKTDMGQAAIAAEQDNANAEAVAANATASAATAAGFFSRLVLGER